MTKWQSFMNEVKKVRSELNNPKLIWYRGHRNKKHTLLPALLRFSNGKEKELDLFTKFKQLSFGLIEERKLDWEVLIDMQHYSVPTRLLDWTEVLGIAIYFALLGNPDSPCIWILDPLALNEASVNTDKLIRCDQAGFEYKDIYLKGKAFTKSPVAIEPPLKNDRIKAQKGVFTVHGNDTRPLEEIFPNIVKKIDINNKDLIEEARSLFDIFNTNDSTLFPDLQGLSSFLMKFSKLK